MPGDDGFEMEKQPPAATIGIYAINLLAILCTLLAVLAGIHVIYFRSQSNRRAKTMTCSCDVPFVVLRDDASQNNPTTKSLDRMLRSVMEEYQHESSQALAGLSRMLEEALASEATIETSTTQKLLSTKLETRIEKTAACLEHNEKVLAALLGNFSYNMALPEKESRFVAVNDSNATHKDQLPNATNHRFRTHSSSHHKPPTSNASETHSYDSATQLWAHLVRDWTVDGRSIRHSLYDWCCQQMSIYATTAATVLVPGSGMGRLAFDLYQRGYNVEANELSVSMVIAASSLLRTKLSGSFYPYVLDSMTNEVDSKNRFVSVPFPDVPIHHKNTTTHGSLSYTVGDFVGSDDDYYFRERVGDFDAIVTCFFIDTATNIYEYLTILHRLVKPHGVWINVGPVQWHHNALLRPSVDELKDLLEAFGWTIQSWKVDATPISYRNDNDANEFQLPPRRTSYDGYRPLRFVAIRK